MPRVRVLLANQPRFMRELVFAIIGDEPDIEVVGQAHEDSEVAEAVDRWRPDYLIMTLLKPEPQSVLCGFLLAKYPGMKILAVSVDGNKSVAYWSVSDIRSGFVEPSKQGLLRVLRDERELATRDRSQIAVVGEH
jgi:two-component system response regulator DegU